VQAQWQSGGGAKHQGETMHSEEETKQRVTEAVQKCNVAFDGLSANEVLSALTELLCWTIHGFQLEKTDEGFDGIMDQLRIFARERVDFLSSDPVGKELNFKEEKPTLQ
jgi:hypothetical protein